MHWQASELWQKSAQKPENFASELGAKQWFSKVHNILGLANANFRNNLHFSDKFKNKAKFGFIMANKRFLSYNAMNKIMHEAGALRVSDEAKAALAEVLEQKALNISTIAKRLAEHAGRKTITKKDIQLAEKQ